MRVAWSDDGSLEIAARLFDVKQIDRLIRALQVQANASGITRAV